ncbi:hypothetical protein [Streptomyces sp. R41]|uniref:Uncharacterized protein n=1 Tax=Streptomyces sp. R41 TaxID=3238632 RepID=A0AB39RGC5_9ACTN
MDWLAFFGSPIVTLVLTPVAVALYLWGTRARRPSPAKRWAAIGMMPAVAGYGAATVYGLAFLHPLDLCASKTGDGAYMDTMRDYALDHVTVEAFPPRVTCFWGRTMPDGDPQELIASFWARGLMYVGVAVAVPSAAKALLDRRRKPH